MSIVETTLSLSTLQQATVDEVARCLSLGEAYFGREFQLDAIRFDLRGRSAGQFRVRPTKRSLTGKKLFKELRFNTLLLDKYRTRFIDETVGHEVAHFLVSELYQRKVRPHGREWQAIMREVLGQNPEVTHNYKVQPARTLKRFDYHCACENKIHKLTSIRHQRVLSRKANYLCRECNQALRYYEV